MPRAEIARYKVVAHPWGNSLAWVKPEPNPFQGLKVLVRTDKRGRPVEVFGLSLTKTNEKKLRYALDLFKKNPGSLAPTDYRSLGGPYFLAMSFGKVPPIIESLKSGSRKTPRIYVQTRDRDKLLEHLQRQYDKTKRNN